MHYYSPWVFFVLVAAILALVSMPIFRGIDVPPVQQGSRLVVLDGLRGLLALSGVVYHAGIFHVWLLTGIWFRTPSHFYNSLGNSGFALFFMITGFLFWSQLLSAQGKPAWFKLYIGRVFRIGPVFYVMLFLLLLVTFATSGWKLHQPPAVVLLQVVRWGFMGLFGNVELNANPYLLPLAGVVWTLRYEWLFYLSLPLLAFAARLRKFHLLALILLLLVQEAFIHLTASPRKVSVSFTYSSCWG